MHESERRYYLTEIRLEGRSLAGVALRYGDEARLPWGVVERFDSGAFGDVSSADVILNEMHNRDRPLARTGGGGLTLLDDSTSLRIRAELPETAAANDVLALVRGRVYRGLSVEFHTLREAQADDVRIIQSARLSGVAVVDTPAYPASYVDSMRARFEARSSTRRRRVWL